MTPETGQFVRVPKRPKAGAVISRIDAERARVSVIWSNAKRAWLATAHCEWDPELHCWQYKGPLE